MVDIQYAVDISIETNCACSSVGQNVGFRPPAKDCARSSADRALTSGVKGRMFESSRARTRHCLAGNQRPQVRVLSGALVETKLCLSESQTRFIASLFLGFKIACDFEIDLEMA